MSVCARCGQPILECPRWCQQGGWTHSVTWAHECHPFDPRSPVAVPVI